MTRSTPIPRRLRDRHPPRYPSHVPNYVPSLPNPPSLNVQQFLHRETNALQLAGSSSERPTCDVPARRFGVLRYAPTPAHHLGSTCEEPIFILKGDPLCGSFSSQSLNLRLAATSLRGIICLFREGGNATDGQTVGLVYRSTAVVGA